MSLGNTSLHQRGEIPEIVKLPNGRIRVIRRFHKFTREDVDNANLGSTMGDFGDLDTTGEQVANQGYTDCRLISVEVDTRFGAVSNNDNAVLVKTYETLTSSFVQITDDTIEYDDNGLKKVTRVYRAVSGTTSPNTVGTTNFDSDGTTVYLASSQIEDNDAFAQLTEEYTEAGLIDTLVQNLDAGVRKVTQTFIVQEGTTVGPVISRNTQNVGGLPVITVTTLQDADGNAINSGGTNLIRSYESLVNFTYPGVVSIIRDELAARDYSDRDDITSYDFYLTPPSESLVEATTYIFFQDSGNIAASDYTYDSASGLWNPQTWAQSYAHGVDKNDNPFATTKALRGYRANTDVEVVVVEPSSDWQGNFLVNGRPIQRRNVARIGVEGGPENPEGNKYVLDVQITPSYEDTSGNLGYKKKIVVATIPPRIGVSYSPSGSELITADVTDSIGGNRSGVLRAGTYASNLNVIPLDWKNLPSDSNAFTNQARIAISSSDPNYSLSYHRVNSYNPNTGKITFTPSITVNTAYNLYYSINMTNRGGVVIGDEDSTNKIRLQASSTAFSRLGSFDDYYNGTQVKVTRPDGTNQTRTITAFDGRNRVATVSAAFSPAIGPNDTYLILQ
jgi:hypothetical protein